MADSKNTKAQLILEMADLREQLEALKTRAPDGSGTNIRAAEDERELGQEVQEETKTLRKREEKYRSYLNCAAHGVFITNEIDSFLAQVIHQRTCLILQG